MNDSNTLIKQILSFGLSDLQTFGLSKLSLCLIP